MKDISKSFALQERAKARIPGLSQLLSKRPDRFSYGVWPGYFSRAEGVRVWDLDGNEYVDMSIGGIGATVLGYQDPEVDEAVREAMGRGVASSLNCPEEVELADLLCELHPWAEMARFGRCGGEAMAVAVRIARAAAGRDKVAFCGYHGWHDWYLAANLGTENALGEHLISGLDPAGVPRGLAGTALPFSYNDAAGLEAIVAAHGKDLAAVVMEPIRSSRPEPGFLERVRELADSCGAALVVDEVSAGFRLGCGGAHLGLGLEPDLAVFSKALGNGYPVSAVIGRARYMEAAQHSFISSTNWTERTGSAAALAMVRKFRRVKAHERLMALGEAVQAGWVRLGEKHGLPLHAGGIAPLSHFAFEVAEPLAAKAYFVQLMLDRGFLASTIFYSMFAHGFEHVEAYLTAVDEAFAEIARAVAAGDLKRKLRGQPAASGFKRLA
ncbi:MAG: aminotransferase class III-fold pyridoxal phosphate-dependent enzyme [Thermodesulfobacteriota bacterium]